MKKDLLFWIYPLIYLGLAIIAIKSYEPDEEPDAISGPDFYVGSSGIVFTDAGAFKNRNPEAIDLPLLHTIKSPYGLSARATRTYLLYDDISQISTTDYQGNLQSAFNVDKFHASGWNVPSDSLWPDSGLSPGRSDINDGSENLFAANRVK